MEIWHGTGMEHVMEWERNIKNGTRHEQYVVEWEWNAKQQHGTGTKHDMEWEWNIKTTQTNNET